MASGGDIGTAVLNAAVAAASEPGDDASKAIHQRHLEGGIRDVVAGTRIMQQSLFHPDTSPATSASGALEAFTTRMGSAGAWAAVSIAALAVALTALLVALLR